MNQRPITPIISEFSSHLVNQIVHLRVPNEPPADDSLRKELEELRKLKADVEAKQKAEKEKPATVDVSSTFFSKKEEELPEPKSNSEKT